MTRTKRQLHGLALVAGFAAAVSACSFLVDTSGLRADAVPDASTMPGDATADGPALVGVDAPSDTTDTGTDAPGGRLCADAGSAICDDFDDSTTLGPGWKTEDGGGAVTVVPEGLSAPNALSLSVPTAGAHAYAYRTIPFVKSVRCALDMKFLDPPTGSEVDYLVIHTAAQNHNLYLAQFDGSFALAEWKETGGIDRTTPVQAPPLGKWIHVVLATDGKDLTLQMDGASYTLPNVVDVTGPDRQLVFGMFYAKGNAPTRVLYDDILCTVGP